MKTWIKICGTTNAEDAHAAVAAGADALGFILSDSRRKVSAEEVRSIVTGLPAGVEKIGVFVNENAEVVAEAITSAGLTGVQLHGDESPQYGSRLRQMLGNGTKILVAISAGSDQRERFSSFSGAENSVDAFIVDSGNVTMRGGTGQVFDWLRESDFVMALQENVRVVIAGGLSPENVGAAVTLFRPWGLDVVTGVEVSYGKKDHEKLRRFISAVRDADAKGIAATP
ncbi:MAG: trpF [Acidobacteriales bacterium]|nr:trpF [Terriglobales bacterium]